MVLLAVVPAAIATCLILSDPHVRFAVGVYIGIVVAATCIGIAYLRSLVFESRHLGESADFWLSQEAKVRPRAFYSCLLLAGVGTLIVVLALAKNATFVAGPVPGPVLRGGLQRCPAVGQSALADRAPM